MSMPDASPSAAIARLMEQWQARVQELIKGPKDHLASYQQGKIDALWVCVDELDAALRACAEARPSTEPGWQPIETAPPDGQFLVTDGRRQVVFDGKMLTLSRKANTPQHLSGHHWTHWMPLPAPPRAEALAPAKEKYEEAKSETSEKAADQRDVQDDAAPRITEARRADEGSGGSMGTVLVAGERMERPIYAFVLACDRLLADEQAKPNPDNALIAVLCDAVRLTRELEAMAKEPLRAEALPPAETPVHDVAASACETSRTEENNNETPCTDAMVGMATDAVGRDGAAGVDRDRPDLLEMLRVEKAMLDTLAFIDRRLSAGVPDHMPVSSWAADLRAIKVLLRNRRAAALDAAPSSTLLAEIDALLTWWSTDHNADPMRVMQRLMTIRDQAAALARSAPAEKVQVEKNDDDVSR